MNAQGADVVAVGRAQRRSGVESDPRPTRDEGVLDEPPVLVGVEHDHGLTEKMTAKRFRQQPVLDRERREVLTCSAAG